MGALGLSSARAAWGVVIRKSLNIDVYHVLILLSICTLSIFLTYIYTYIHIYIHTYIYIYM
jgi:hypothetical protein